MNFLKDKTFVLIIVALALLVIVLAFGLGNSPFSKSPTSEVTQEEGFSSCVVFSEGYCSDWMVAKYLDIDAIGFQLPDGAEIYAPFDGVFISSQQDGSNQIIGRVDSESKDGINPGMSFTIFGHYDSIIESGSQVAKGQLLGRVVGDRLFGDGYGSTIVVFIQGLEPNGPAYSNPELYKSFFSNI